MRRISMITLIATLAITACSGSDTDEPTADTDATATEPASTDSEATESEPTEADPAQPTSDDDAETGSPDADEPAAEPDATTEADEPAAPTPVTEDDLTLFIAAAERALEGSAQESVVFDDPEIYIALGQTSCARFADGDSFDAIATDLLSDLSTEGAQDENRLVGAILGAATTTLCPEHADKI